MAHSHLTAAIEISQCPLLAGSLPDSFDGQSLDADHFLAGFDAAFEGDLAGTQVKNFREKFNERRIGLAFDGRRAKPDFEDLAAVGVRGPTDNLVGSSAGLDADGEAQSQPFGRMIFQSQPRGSKNSSTTRSFSGMMALSVMVIDSGQTFVQHLVMLQ